MARAKLTQRTRVIRSESRKCANTAVEIGSVSINKAALLASDHRVPQVMKTCPGNIPSNASRKKVNKSRLDRSLFR